MVASFDAATGRLEFFVPGTPRAKERPRFGQGQVFTAPKTLRAEQRAAACCSEVMAGALPLEGPLLMAVRVVDMVPKSWSKKDKAAALWKTSKPDLDNIWKLIKDSLKGIAWQDDAQVVYGRQQKVYSGELPGLYILIRPAEVADYLEW